VIYSVQLWSVRDQFASDPTRTLEQLQSAGFTAVEPFDLVDFADNHADTASRLGLSVPSAHVPLIGQADLSAVVGAASALGTRTLIDPGRRDGWDDPMAFRDFANDLNGHARTLGPHGLRVGYHNHWWEFATSGDSTALEVFAELLHPDVVLELDIYWASIGGVDAAALLRRLRKRVSLMHVKDGTVTPNPPFGSQVVAGSGEVPIAEALAAAPQALRVLEFDEYPGDLMGALELGLRAVRELDAQR